MKKNVITIWLDMVNALIILTLYAGALFLALCVVDMTGLDSVFQSLSFEPLGILLSVLAHACLWIFFLPILLFFLRTILPRLEEGSFDVPSRGLMVWMIHLALSRSLSLVPVGSVVYFFSILRFLYLRALGCKNAFRINTSLSVSITDFPLLTIADGAFLADKVTVSCHEFVDGKLKLKRVHIGKDCRILINSVIAPGTYMEEGVVVGQQCTTTRCYLEKGSRVHHNTIAAEVRVPRGKTYFFLPRNPEEHKHPDFEAYRHPGNGAAS
ncbi:hypothetical protein ACFLU6_01005 [Acidobacteriota bacterium]